MTENLTARREIERRDRILAPVATRDVEGKVTGAKVERLRLALAFAVAHEDAAHRLDVRLTPRELLGENLREGPLRVHGSRVTSASVPALEAGAIRSVGVPFPSLRQPWPSPSAA
jgi:hypothetical protein